MVKTINLKRAPSLNEIIKILDKESSEKSGIAKFNKVANHVHTPQSHDYKFFHEMDYSDELSYFNNLMNLALKNKTILDVYKEENFNNPKFKDASEELSFLIFAKKLHDKGIDAVIITDHNDVKGIDKLNTAFSILKKQRKIVVKCSILNGIEISCADKTHVVGIFDNNSKIQIEKWLNENIMDVNSGTFQTSFEVLKFINSIGGIGYIAHANSNELITNGSNLSGGYKKKLLNLPFMNLIGIKDNNQIHNLDKCIYQYRSNGKKIFHIIDEDSHSFSELGSNTFWLKGEKINFLTLKAATNEFNLHFYYGEKPKSPKTFIKSMCVIGNGFLKNSKNDKPFSISFSERMNSFIGGRGTGKSTILDLIDLVLSQQISNSNKLYFLLKQGKIGLLVNYKEENYYLLFGSSENEKNNKIFVSNYKNKFRNNNYLISGMNNRDARKFTLRKRLQVYKKINNTEIEEITKKINLIDNLYTRQFSINNLVEIASKGDLTDFVFELLKNSQINNNYLNKKINSFKSLKTNYLNLYKIKSNRFHQFENFISSFNSKESKQLKLLYMQKNINDIEFDWYDIFGIKKLNKYFQSMNITCSNIIEYLSDLSEEKNAIEVFIKVMDKDYNFFNIYNIQPYLEKDGIKITDNNLKRIDNEKNLKQFIDELYIIMEDHGLYYISNYFEKYLAYLDDFRLQFNINSKVDDRTLKDKFIDVENLSMGQKVVAMLDFILAYDDFSKELNPLIIDQPEDNLDNMYIYNNLVKDLIRVKGKRQVIIASHNSTIVVNSGTEKVIIMDMKNGHGEIQKTGYILTKNVSSKIVNILEGGKEAFKKKASIYNIK